MGSSAPCSTSGSLAKAGVADRLGAFNEAATFAALDALAAFDRAKVESLIGDVLAKRNRAMLVLHGTVANVARLHGMKGLVPALASAFAASVDAPAEIGMALAALAPKKAREVALRRAKKKALTPASQEERERLFGKKSIAAALVEAAEDTQAVLEAFMRSRDANPRAQ